MAFTQIAKSTQGARAAEEIRMGSRMQSTTVAKRSVYFAIARAIIEQVGWSMDGAGDERIVIQIAINEGSEEDAGFLLLTEDKAKGYILGTNKGSIGKYSLAGSVSVTRFQHYVLNDTERDIEPHAVEYTVDTKDKSILIQCPDWLRYNPLSVPEKVEPVKPPTVVDMHHKGRRRQVR